MSTPPPVAVNVPPDKEAAPARAGAPISMLRHGAGSADKGAAFGTLVSLWPGRIGSRRGLGCRRRPCGSRRDIVWRYRGRHGIGGGCRSGFGPCRFAGHCALRCRVHRVGYRRQCHAGVRGRCHPRLRAAILSVHVDGVLAQSFAVVRIRGRVCLTRPGQQFRNQQHEQRHQDDGAGQSLLGSGIHARTIAQGIRAPARR